MARIELPAMTPTERMMMLMIMETPIPMVEMMEPCSDPSSTPAETWAILAQGTRMLEIFPERNAM